jgi:hypothetical protein
MSNVAAGTVWNLPNYLGELFTASSLQTPVLQMAGGLNGVKSAENFEFAVAQTYDHEAASQPAITETTSLTAPTAISYVRAEVKNVAQIHQEQVSISYAKMSVPARLSGIATSGTTAVVPSEKDFQVARALEKIARDFEYSLIQGAYQIATNAGVANKTRGLNAAAAAGSTVAAGSVALSKTLIDNLLRTMYAAGAVFMNPVFIVNAFQKQKISSIYGYAPTDRNVGGLNIKQVETDFGNIGVILDSFQSTSVLLCADMSFVSVVSQPVVGKGHLFYEELARAGASEQGQVYGQLGVDHGPYFMHGSITGLTTS